MATASDLLRVARAEVGNTSGRKYWDAYWRGSWSYVDGDTTPYCACFVSWCLKQAGVTAPHFPSAVAFDWADVGGRGIPPQNLEAGDLVAFDWDGDGVVTTSESSRPPTVAASTRPSRATPAAASWQGRRATRRRLCAESHRTTTRRTS